ncbi:putative signal peptide protein [Puccinia sorghi]|uniref:Putative signal peptide protein n=1 Tax=Puccinia sorghi TaxID=27349 RepID=A0A0L6V104_9BASI|nr:putative signal peptide protein [Puccinia sorghi]
MGSCDMIECAIIWIFKMKLVTVQVLLDVADSEKDSGKMQGMSFYGEVKEYFQDFLKMHVKDSKQQIMCLESKRKKHQRPRKINVNQNNFKRKREIKMSATKSLAFGFLRSEHSLYLGQTLDRWVGVSFPGQFGKQGGECFETSLMTTNVEIGKVKMLRWMRQVYLRFTGVFFLDLHSWPLQPLQAGQLPHFPKFLDVQDIKLEILPCLLRLRVGDPLKSPGFKTPGEPPQPHTCGLRCRGPPPRLQTQPVQDPGNFQPLNQVPLPYFCLLELHVQIGGLESPVTGFWVVSEKDLLRSCLLELIEAILNYWEVCHLCQLKKEETQYRYQKDRVCVLDH